MPLSMNASPDAIARAYDAYVDRLHDEYYREYGECPQCGGDSLDGEGGRSRKGWWSRVWCVSDDCDYETDDCEVYEPDDYY